MRNKRKDKIYQPSGCVHVLERTLCLVEQKVEYIYIYMFLSLFFGGKLSNGNYPQLLLKQLQQQQQHLKEGRRTHDVAVC